MTEETKSKKPQWAMVIDLDRCTGCEACVVACRVENNIPTVGPEEAAKGRSINWIRVERYFEGEYPDVKVKFMPVLCQHCEEAPCEPVCPVYATYHTDEGLNAQVYNRCVGTRYCANNCPYTVRFFNFFDPVWDAPLEKALNPEVSVRTRGVMEKCTFCIQRIRKGEEKPKTKGAKSATAMLCLHAFRLVRRRRCTSATSLIPKAKCRGFRRAIAQRACLRTWERNRE